VGLPGACGAGKQTVVDACTFTCSIGSTLNGHRIPAATVAVALLPSGVPLAGALTPPTGDPPQALDGGGADENLNGTGAPSLPDVTFPFDDRNVEHVGVNPPTCDYDGSGRFTPADVTRLFLETT